MQEINSFKKGIGDGMPICIGYFSVSFAFGIFAVASGLTVIEAVLMSMTNLTSAGQLAAVPIICAGGGVVELLFSQLVINSRYALMSVSLSQKLSPGVNLFNRFLIAFGNTDEIFAVSTSQNGLVTSRYMYGLILSPFVGWSTGTLLGAVAGNVLPAVLTTSLGVAIYGMFIAIIVPPAKKSLPTLLCILTAIALSCAFKFIPVLSKVPSGFAIIICAVAASVLFALVAPIKEKQTEEVSADE